ncbi:hypothetical protein [Dyella caseinilytica]|uniref:DUF1877 family protein n=1 Tax=Dyella caseinilytica TaxID=1849581 RepID=A0ABX7GXY6_9GAMM|nr:hypothetical protein [Dyella caseinilytica]QRN54841.1 hypothetical protein ISN74_05660 [Dyella caseinilytica]GFZ97291.1 hypothetical protein GCM10011408_17200 [Dyella caseinilytica]
MTVLHSAFVFHAAADLGEIATRCHSAGEFEPALLSALARNTVAQAGHTQKALLASLRFDPEWLDEVETPDPSYRVLIVLTDFLQPVPSLSRSVRSGFAVLEAILPLFGWDRASMKELLHGQPIEALLKSTKLPYEAAPYYAGWIPKAHVALLQSRLAAVPDRVPDVPAQVQDALSGTIAYEGRDARTLFSESLADARAMLAAARERDADLFLILD